MKEIKPDCKNWLGYKPCGVKKNGLQEREGCGECLHYSPILGNSLIIEAGGLGSVLRTSVVSQEMKRMNPQMQVQWLTHEKGAELLENIPNVDNVIVGTEEGNLLILQAQEYDSIINFESSPLFLAIAKQLKADEKFGFMMSEFGKLIPASPHAQEFLTLQTEDYFRRRINTKPMQRLLLETAGFQWSEQAYELITKKRDNEWAREFLYENRLTGEGEHPKIIGLNIGSSRKNNAKRWPVENFYNLAVLFQKEYPQWKFMILAGPEDEDIYELLKTMNGGRSGNLFFPGCKNSISQFISLVDTLPIVISADTFGMHVAIALQKNVISLHGPQPEQEIFLYGKGQKVHLNLECAPCFSPRIEKCVNNQRLQCMRGLDVDNVGTALRKEVNNYENS